MLNSCCNDNRVYPLDAEILKWGEPFEGIDSIAYRKEYISINGSDTSKLIGDTIFWIVDYDFRTKDCHEECSPGCEELRYAFGNHSYLGLQAFGSRSNFYIYFAMQNNEVFVWRAENAEISIGHSENGQISHQVSYSYQGKQLADVFEVTTPPKNENYFRFIYSQSMGLLEASKVSFIRDDDSYLRYETYKLIGYRVE